MTTNSEVARRLRRLHHLGPLDRTINTIGRENSQPVVDLRRPIKRAHQASSSPCGDLRRRMAGYVHTDAETADEARWAEAELWDGQRYFWGTVQQRGLLFEPGRRS